MYCQVPAPVLGNCSTSITSPLDALRQFQCGTESPQEQWEEDMAKELKFKADAEVCSWISKSHHKCGSTIYLFKSLSFLWLLHDCKWLQYHDLFSTYSEQSATLFFCCALWLTYEASIFLSFLHGTYCIYSNHTDWESILLEIKLFQLLYPREYLPAKEQLSIVIAGHMLFYIERQQIFFFFLNNPWQKIKECGEARRSVLLPLWSFQFLGFGFFM